MRAWARWVALLQTQEDARPLAAFRIAIGVCVWLSVGSVVTRGLVAPLWVHVDHGGMLPLDGTLPVQLVGGPTPAVVWTLVGLTLVGGTALVVGLGGRVTAFVTLQAFLALVDSNGVARGGYDLLLANALWLLVLGGGGATWSIDARLRTGAWASGATMGAWVRWLVVFQLLLMYWTTGLQKLSTHWVPGGDLGALYYILQQPTWQRFDGAWLESWFRLTQAMTLLTWVWEVTIPVWAVAVAMRELDVGGRVRRVLDRGRVVELYAAVGVAFHLVVVALMEIGPFSWISLAYYAALFPVLRKRAPG